jgi:hypothetical protein
MKDRKNGIPNDYFLPYICGLTASPLTDAINYNNRHDQIYDQIKNNLTELCINLDSSYVNYNLTDVKLFINECKLSIVNYTYEIDIDFE